MDYQEPCCPGFKSSSEAHLLLLCHNIVQAVVEELQVLLQEWPHAQVQARKVSAVGHRIGFNAVQQ